MDVKEINILVKSLNKAFAAGEPAANIIDILNKLNANVVATEEFLRSTKVGVAVNRQKQHKSQEVSRLATEIVARWKDEVNKNKGAKKVTGSPNKSPLKSGPPTPAKKSKSPEAVTVPLEQRTWKTDKVDIKRTGNELRDRGVGLLYDGLACNSTETPTCVIRHAIEVEQAAMDTYGPETQSEYKGKLRSLFQNLKNKSNPELRVRVLTDEITAARFVVMTHEELKSAKQRAEDAKYQKENMDKAMVAQVEKSVSSSLQCGRCGQKKVSYSQAQTRSADEPMTTFCECQVCGHRWKFS